MKRRKNMNKKTIKGIISLILSICMAVGIIPIGVVKTGAETGEDILQNPIKDNNGNTVWDCVWFGSYPQAEVIPSGTYSALKSSLLKDGDTVISDSLYSQLKNATGWSTNGDITLGGNKYRRIKKSDATWVTSYTGSYYNWSDSTTYHYFKYEPIRWRVLKINGNDAFLLADKGLDDQLYNTELRSVTWETSTIRSWLNGYSASSNACGTDYSGKNFINTAFSSSEQSAIKNTSVINDDNLSLGTEGGNNTTDQIFLLSESEVYTDSATSYGFDSRESEYDPSRRSESSTYAKAMGIYSETSLRYRGSCCWWLRSPGFDTDRAAYILCFGGGFRSGYSTHDSSRAIRPALHLNLSSSNLYSYAGTVCSDGTINETEKPKSFTFEITYLAMSELAYCECSPTNGKPIKESGDLEKYIKKQASSPDTLIPNANLNLTNKQFIEILFKYIEDWKIVDTYEDKTSGFYAVALEKDGKHVFAIRGSQDLSNTYNLKTDWLDNATYGLFEQTSKQMMNVLYFAALDKEKYSVTDDNYTITGHSLGGGLGDLAGNLLGVKAITFDGSPTTDVSYYRLPEFMSANFRGVNEWSSMDYINENCPVGNLELNMKKHSLLVDRHTDSNIFSAHARWSIVDYDKSNDCLLLSPEVNGGKVTFSTNTIIKKEINRISPTVISDAVKATNNTYAYNVLKNIGKMTNIGRTIDFTSKLNKVFPKGTLYLGGSDSQFISASLKLNNIHTDVIYGGDGNDKIYGFYGDDYLIGGNGNDTLDGGDGNDKYIYWKGQGTDTIIDESGNETLYLYGYNDNDVITFESDSKYIYVKSNTQTIIKISKMRNPFNVTNSFDVIVYKENEIQQERLQDWNYWKNVRGITIACPTKVQVYDKEDKLVLELEDELDEPIYTEFGQFYVSNEQGELVKHLLLEDTYKVKVIATADGTMNFASHQDDGSTLDVLSAEDIPINEGEEYNIDFVDDVSLKKNGNDITLKKTSIVKAIDITVNKDNVEINKGETYQISTNITPANSTEVLNYESLNSSIATVDSKGKITAIAKGECVIAVYTESGVSTNIIVKVKENNKVITNHKTTRNNATTTEKKATSMKKPAKVKIKKVAVKKKSAKKVKITLKKIKAKGYQVAIYKTKKNAKKNNKAIVKKIVKKANRIKVTISSNKLKNKKTLFVRVRAYTLNGKKKVYGTWSTVKEVKVKK